MQNQCVNNPTKNKEGKSKNTINDTSDDLPTSSMRRRQRRKAAKDKLKGEVMNLSTSNKLNVQTENVGNSNIPHNPKKRNKSVSLMLEDGEGVVIKKDKSKSKDLVKNKLNKKKNIQIKVKEDKENAVEPVTSTNSQIKDSESGENKRRHSGKTQKKETRCEIPDVDHALAGGDSINASAIGTDAAVEGSLTPNIKNHFKKGNRDKKQKSQDTTEKKPVSAQNGTSSGTPASNLANNAGKRKRSKKNKHTNGDVTKSECSEPRDKAADETAENTKNVINMKKRVRKPTKRTDTADVPNQAKKSKTDKKAEDIGDNVHTTTNSLDKITVKTNKKSINKVTSNITEEKMENSSKEKPKRKKNRKKMRNLDAVVLVQNIPFSILLNYRRVLTEHFSKFGKVHAVGIADLKCDKDNSKPIFTTRIFFASEKEAEEALADDKSLFHGNTIRVKKFVRPNQAFKPGAPAKNTLRPGKTESKQTKENDETFCENFDHDSSDSV